MFNRATSSRCLSGGFSRIAALFLCVAAAPYPTTPAPGPVHIIGGGANGGCFAGGLQLPDQGPGFQVINRTRSSFWGVPQTIERVEMLGRAVKAAGLPDIYVGDISRPRGGPIPGAMSVIRSGSTWISRWT